MKQTVRFGRVAGIPVGGHWSVLLIMLLLVQLLALTVLPATAPGGHVIGYWLAALLMVVLFMAALLAHELGHALVARHYGVPVRGITLWLLGGLSELDGRAPHARADLLIALAGPAVSFASAAGFTGLAVASSWLGAGGLPVVALVWLALINVVLGVFNLLPGSPLDGGRVLAAVLWWIRGDQAAGQRAASRAGMVLGAVLIAAGIAQNILAADLGGLWLVLIGWFLVVAANAENADARLRAVGDAPVSAVMTSPPVAGYAHQNVADFVASIARAEPHRSYPVLDLDGRLTGVVSLARLGRVPPQRRRLVRLAEVQAGRDQVHSVRPQTALAEAARQLTGRHRLLPVLSDGEDRLVGVVCRGDLTRTLTLASLGVRPPPLEPREPREPRQPRPVESGS